MEVEERGQELKRQPELPKGALHLLSVLNTLGEGGEENHRVFWQSHGEMRDQATALSPPPQAQLCCNDATHPSPGDGNAAPAPWRALPHPLCAAALPGMLSFPLHPTCLTLLLGTAWKSDQGNDLG